jgi:hypothetical protein
LGLSVAATGGSETETFWALGALVSGTGEIFYPGPITPSIMASNGATPQLGTGTTILEA